MQAAGIHADIIAIILEEALGKTRRRSLAEALAEIPDVGLDEDFERVKGERAPDVFA